MRLWNWARRVRSPKSGRVADGQKVVLIEWDEGRAFPREGARIRISWTIVDVRRPCLEGAL